MGKYNLGGFNLSSSVDPEELATSVKSVILGLSSVIVIFGAYKGIAISDAQVQFTAGQIGLAISSIGFLFGLIRKAVVFFTSK